MTYINPWLSAEFVSAIDNTPIEKLQEIKDSNDLYEASGLCAWGDSYCEQSRYIKRALERKKLEQ